MGENQRRIHVVGSPDIDLMQSEDLPMLDDLKERYEIPFTGPYAVFAYHSVTTNLHNLLKNIKEVVSALVESKKDYVMIYPNNDPGADIIIEEIESLKDNPHFRVFPSLRFEYFLTLMKNCEFMIGNSSAGIREAPVYGIPAINIGSRQNNRFKGEMVIDVVEKKTDILKAIKNIKKVACEPSNHFGNGESAKRFLEILKNSDFWNIELQKSFVDDNST